MRAKSQRLETPSPPVKRFGPDLLVSIALACALA